MSDSTIPVTNSADKTTANVAQDDSRNAESAVSGVVPKSEYPRGSSFPFLPDRLMSHLRRLLTST